MLYSSYNRKSVQQTFHQTDYFIENAKGNVKERFDTTSLTTEYNAEGKSFSVKLQSTLLYRRIPRSPTKMECR